MRRVWLLLCLTACSQAPAPDVSLRKGEVEVLRDEAAALWTQQRDLEWQAYTKGTAVDVGETFRGHETLYSKQTADRLLREMNTSPDVVRQRALRYLRRHILWELTGFETHAAQSELDTLKNATVVMVNGTGTTLAELPGLQAKEPDAQKRRDLQAAAVQVYDRLSDAHLKLDREIAKAVKTLGFSSYMALSSELRLVDLADVGRMAETFMAQTDAIYLPAAKAVVKQELGIDFEKVRLADMPRLMRSPRYDAWFNEDTLLSEQAATLKPLGMALTEQLGLTLDLDKRLTKQKRPRTFAVRVPGDVRLALTPSAGLAAYEAALHEPAHALLYTRTATPVFEFQVLGDQTLIYAYGFVLQNLIGNPEWLKTHAARVPAAEQAALSRYIAWKRLALGRRYAAKVMFEVAWHNGQQGDLAQLYQNLMSRAHGFRLDEVDAKRWLVDHEAFFLSAQFLRAWFLAAQIEQKLVAAYGARWFERREAGDWLNTLFKRGLEPTADEIAKELGNGRLDGGTLVEVLKPRL